ncbi:MAG: family 1 glycosylhydrolase [Cellulomonas sp.]
MSNQRPAAFEPGALTWALGIEDTCVYPRADDQAPPLDEHKLTQHDERWRDDLELAASLGATAVRYGASWPLVHIAPDTFDWEQMDRVVAFAANLDLTIVADLVHYGCPTWLAGSFLDPAFPAALEQFAAAFAARYRGRVNHITPLNEPVTTASFSGLRGVWPPYGQGWDTWVAVTMNIAEAVVAAERAIHAANPLAVVVHVEAALLYETHEPLLQGEVDHLTELAQLPLDLVTGKVDGEHSLHGWLVDHLAEPARIAALAKSPARIDILGVNYYPNLSPREVVRHDGGSAQVAIDRGGEGLARVLGSMAARYGLPLAVTETSIEGDDTTRSNWLHEAVACAVQLRRDGIDLRGLTWWPLFDFVDWSFTAGGESVEEFLVSDSDSSTATYLAQQPLGDPTDGVEPFLRRMGLVRLQTNVGGGLDRVETTSAKAFRSASSNE